jgi:hypothetical protein
VNYNREAVVRKAHIEFNPRSAVGERACECRQSIFRREG